MKGIIIRLAALALLLGTIGVHAGLQSGARSPARASDADDGNTSASSRYQESRSLETSFSDFVKPNGDIRFPTRDYRSEWTHLGTFVIPADEATGFHDVYTQPQAISAFKENGTFPDGAVIIKEVRATDTARLTTGEASWAGAPVQWFVMIKDEMGRYPDNPLWGKGWGWALFEAEEPGMNVSTSYKTDCLGCHIPAQATDWIFIQGYPSIRE